jgi:hypothetical protein
LEPIRTLPRLVKRDGNDAKRERGESLYNDRLRFAVVVDYAADRIKGRSGELHTKEPVDEGELRYVELDVHVDSIKVAVPDEKDEPRSLGAIPNTAEAVRKLVARLGPCATLRVCCEAASAGSCSIGCCLRWTSTVP